MKRVLITGAGGFVGSYLIKEFKENGYEIIACDINKGNLKEEGILYYDMDILNPEIVEKIIKENNPDYIINLAAISSVGLSWNIPAKTMEVNIIGTLNILEAVRKNCLNCKILLIGSSEEYGVKNTAIKEEDTLDANNPYGISKVACENIAKMYVNRYGMKIVCTRSFNHTGIGQGENFAIPSFCKQVAEIDVSGKPGEIHVGNLSAYRDLSDVKDIVKVYRALLENNTEDIVYNVGSGKSHKMEDLLKYIISLSNQEIEIVVDEEKFRKVDTPYVCCDNSKTSKYFAGTDIKTTIKEMYEYFREKKVVEST